MGKKLRGITMLVIMLFGILGLTACDNSLSKYKTTKSIELQVYADVKCEVNIYSAEGLSAISKAVTDGKVEITKARNKGGVDMAYKTATNAIDEVEEDEMKDFEFTISVDKVTIEYGENFNVFVTLKNGSGKDFTIAVSILFWPRITGWDYPIEIEAPEYQNILLAANDVLYDSWTFGDDLEVGTHELKFRAGFILNWQQENERHIELWSNIVVLTVQ